MFVANLRIAIAWAVKQPFYYAIKVMGLAIGIMSAAQLIAYVDFVKGYDSHIPNRDNLYRLVGEYVSRENGDRVRYDFGSNAWVEPFKREYASLYTDVGVVVGRNGVLAHETLAYDQEYFFADQGAVSLLGIRLLEGDPASALSGPNKIVLSESAAVRYFGASDGIVGRTLTLDQVHYLAVSGVFEDLPKQTNFPMEALVSLETTE